ncbi:MAG: hypothetical protein K2I64_03805 [Muribaculaceae bacterium]|nr:hypothetical protein [Muribaculaceae bacterium]
MEEYLSKNCVKIAQRPDGRYIINDATTDTLIDDAQGYGFKMIKAAIKYAIPKGWQVINQIKESESYKLF